MNTGLRGVAAAARPDAVDVVLIAVVTTGYMLIGDGATWGDAVIIAVLAWFGGALVRYTVDYKSGLSLPWIGTLIASLVMTTFTDGYIEVAGVILLAGCLLYEVTRTVRAITRRVRHERAMARIR